MRAGELRAFGNFDFGAGKKLGFVIDDVAWPIEALQVPARDLDGLLEQWDEAVERLELIKPTELQPGAPVVSLRVFAPIDPRNLFQSGANYRTHVMQLRVAKALESNPDADVAALEAQAAEMMDERAANDQPYVFLGMTSSISGPFDDVVLPPVGEQHDWELELAVVIRERTYRVSTEEAPDRIAGYTICNDITSRDLVFRPDLPTIGTDWLAGKNAPTFSPMGPYLVPARFVADAQNLQITLKLNGETMQSASTSDMMFSIARLISHVSAYVELLPGDVLLTGSPHGNGAHYGRYLQPGDVLQSTITGLGSQQNHVVRRDR